MFQTTQGWKGKKMIKNVKHLFLVGALTLGACQSVQPLSQPDQSTPAQNQTLINSTEVFAVVNTQVSAVDLEQKAAEWGYSLKHKEKLDGLDMFIMTFKCPPGIDPHEAVVELERLQANSTVSVNHKYSLQLETSKPVTSDKNYADTLIRWPKTGCEARVPIGIIDGGVSADLLQRYESQITYKSFIQGKPSQPALHHGSAIASILLNPNRLSEGEFYIASVVSEDENGEQYSGVYPMLKALNWMVENEVKIVNVSLAGPKNKTLHKAIKRASDKGIIVVAAVGNNGRHATPQYPAAFEDVIAATAVNMDGEVYPNAVRGPHVDFAAPGVKIFIGEDGKGQYVSGTSIAAPFVTATIASHIQNGVEFSVADVTEYLSRTSQDLGADGIDPIYGHGLISAKENCSF